MSLADNSKHSLLEEEEEEDKREREGGEEEREGGEERERERERSQFRFKDSLDYLPLIYKPLGCGSKVKLVSQPLNHISPGLKEHYFTIN